MASPFACKGGASIEEYGLDARIVLTGSCCEGFCAEGPPLTTRREVAEWKERMEEGAEFMTTSCCPAYIETVEKLRRGLGDQANFLKAA